MLGLPRRIVARVQSRAAQVARKLDEPLGRLLYGNLSLLSNNRRGRRLLSRARADAVPAPEHEAVRSFEHDGALPFDGRHDAAVLAKVIEAYRRAIVDPSRYEVVESADAKKAGVPGACHALSREQVPELELLLSDAVRGFLRAFYGGDFAVRYAGARRTFHVPETVASSYDIYSKNWHCDAEPCDRIKLFVLLNDATIAHGPLHIVTRRGTRRLLRRGFKNRLDYGMEEREILESPDLVRMVGPAGTTFFASVTQCLHRAGVPAEAMHRDIVEFQFGLD